MEQQKISLGLVLVLGLAGLGLFFGGFVLAQGMGEGPDQWVLQQSELPEGARIVGRSLEDDDFSGPLSVANFAMRAEGFREGYIVEGEYPCDFRNEAVRELVVDGSGTVGVLNMAYQFHRSEQATAQIEQAVELIAQAAEQDLNQSKGNIEYIELGSLLHDEPLANDNKMQGRIVRATWVEEDVEFVSDLFLGARDKTFVFLAVHGFDDPSSHQAFEALLPKLLQR